MARIRDDLKGSIMVGEHTLRAGDLVPEGVKVHESRLDWNGGPAPEAGGVIVDGVDKPHHAAGVAKWRAYAAAIGLDVPEGADKGTIRALVTEAEDAGH